MTTESAPMRITNYKKAYVEMGEKISQLDSSNRLLDSDLRETQAVLSSKIRTCELQSETILSLKNHIAELESQIESLQKVNECLRTKEAQTNELYLKGQGKIEALEIAMGNLRQIIEQGITR